MPVIRGVKGALRGENGAPGGAVLALSRALGLARRDEARVDSHAHGLLAVGTARVLLRRALGRARVAQTRSVGGARRCCHSGRHEQQQTGLDAHHDGDGDSYMRVTRAGTLEQR